MENLAGASNQNADVCIEGELRRCRITTQEVERSKGEVPYSVVGKLGQFTFTRAWYYWEIKGPLPIEVAEELYADPVGLDDIRVAGYAGNAPPKNHVEWLTADGKQVLPKDKEVGYQKFAKEHPEVFDLGDLVFSNDPESLGAKGHVTSYHIDSEVGLRIFADTLRVHNLIPEVTPA